MPTRYVDTEAAIGGDGTTNSLSGASCAYRSLNIAEAALPADITTGGTQGVWEIVCESNGASHTADTSTVTFSGTTTSATYYLDIKTSASARHAGVWSESKYRLSTSTAGVPLTFSNAFGFIKELQVKQNGSGSSAANGISISPPSGGVASEVVVEENIVVGGYAGVGTSGNYIGINAVLQATGGQIAKIGNNIVYGFQRASGTNWGINAGGNGTVFLYNNTIAGCSIGVKISGSNSHVKNCLAQSCTDGFSGTPNAASTKNCSDIASDAPGSNPVTGTVTFAGVDDYHLSSSDSVAKDAGIDLSGDSGYSITTDIDSETRSGTWDIGADEYVAVGGTTYNDSITLGASAGTSQAAAATFAALLSLGTAAGTAHGAAATMNAALTIGASAGTADGAAAQLATTLSLGAAMSTEAAAEAIFTALVSLSAELGLQSSGGANVFSEAFSLGASAGTASLAAASMAASLAFGASAGTATTVQLEAAAAYALGVVASVASGAVLTANAAAQFGTVLQLLATLPAADLGRLLLQLRESCARATLSESSGRATLRESLPGITISDI